MATPQQLFPLLQLLRDDGVTSAVVTNGAYNTMVGSGSALIEKQIEALTEMARDTGKPVDAVIVFINSPHSVSLINQQKVLAGEEPVVALPIDDRVDVAIAIARSAAGLLEAKFYVAFVSGLTPHDELLELSKYVDFAIVKGGYDGAEAGDIIGAKFAKLGAYTYPIKGQAFAQDVTPVGDGEVPVKVLNI